jgi:hypothetical protein
MNYSVEAQNRGRRLDEEVRPPRLVQPPRRGGQTTWAGLTAQGGGLITLVAALRSFEAEDTRRDRKACVEAKQGCGCWASVRWRKSEDFKIRP